VEVDVITIHVLHEGKTQCDVVGGLLPSEWPKGHKWTTIDDFRGPPDQIMINNNMQRCQQCMGAVLVERVKETNSRAVRGTKDNLLQELMAAAPHLDFALREPHEGVYIPPCTLWERIRQVFTGPRRLKRMAEVEIAVISSRDITNQERANIALAIENTCPAGVLVTVVDFYGDIL